jgi:hypothetical protein
VSAEKHAPGPLRVTAFDATSRQARVQNDHSRVKGNWDDIYVEFSGFFGSYGPHMFAMAPELLSFAKDIHNSAIALPESVRSRLHELIAKAARSAS